MCNSIYSEIILSRVLFIVFIYVWVKRILIFCRFFVFLVEGFENFIEKKFEEYGSKNSEVDKEKERNKEKEEKFDELKFLILNELGLIFVISSFNFVYLKIKFFFGLVFIWFKFKYLNISNVISLKIGKVNLDYKKVGFEFCFFNYFLFKFRDVDFFVSLFIS